MRSASTRLMLLFAFIPLTVPVSAHGQPPKQPDNPYPYMENEPKAKAFSLAKSTEYLNGVARFWMQTKSCGACHANFAYVMAKPLLGKPSSQLLAQTLRFLEERKPKNPPLFSFDSESVAIAFALAWDDARTSGKLRPATRQALRRMWSFQRDNGSWEPMGCGRLLPCENDAHFTATLAAVAAGVAPDGYARSAEAQDGLTKLRRFFLKYPARVQHDLSLRLWASLYLDGLMTRAERAASIKSLLAKQGKDGGWSFGAMHTNPAHPPVPAPSDGYSTGLSIYILREASVPAARSEIVRGVTWLKNNQRASGRWFTPSGAANHPTEGGVGARDLYVQNLGTAFAVLALQACEETDGFCEPVNLRPLRWMTGLSLRERLISD